MDPKPLPSSAEEQQTVACQTQLHQAVELHQQGQLAQAALAYRALLEAEPDHFEARRLLGILHVQRDEHAQAIEQLQQALRLDASQAALYLNLGSAQHALRQSEAALASYAAALQLEPACAAAHYNRGVTLQSMNALEPAIASYDQALQIDPDFVEAYSNRGTSLHGLLRLDEALASYREAVQRQPEHFQAWYNLGLVLHELHRPAEALACYDRALQLKPDFVEALCNYGIALQALNQLDGALACYSRALQLQPGLAEPQWNSGLCHLARGEFELGWQLYEWGRACGQRGPQRVFEQPLWLGQPSLQGKTILLHAEQGLGDTLQFCRYAALLAALGATVWLEVQPSLHSLLASLPGVAGVMEQGATLPQFDYHCPLLSLPLALRTRLDTVPAAAAYLQADPSKIAAWSQRLGAARRPLIGLAWSGNATHKNDALRSIPLARLATLLAQDATFICVQTDLRDADRATLQQFEVLDISQELHDFSDTAALLACLDHVISVDTSVAHLAGALGKPTTLLLPYAADFRWLLQRTDSPWYPSMRLIRQTSANTWDDVIAQLTASLQGHAR
jgi:tetratricopeptide (TPR) repeat protein